MKTVKTYMIRKPSDLQEVKQLTKSLIKERGVFAEEVKVVEKISLTPEQYKEVCSNPLNDYDFLTGKGGYDENDTREVIELACKGEKSLFADPSGSSYCRYLGIAI